MSSSKIDTSEHGGEDLNSLRLKVDQLTFTNRQLKQRHQHISDRNDELEYEIQQYREGQSDAPTVSGASADVASLEAQLEAKDAELAKAHAELARVNVDYAQLMKKTSAMLAAEMSSRRGYLADIPATACEEFISAGLDYDKMGEGQLSEQSLGNAATTSKDVVSVEVGTDSPNFNQIIEDTVSGATPPDPSGIQNVEGLVTSTRQSKPVIVKGAESQPEQDTEEGHTVNMAGDSKCYTRASTYSPGVYEGLADYLFKGRLHEGSGNAGILLDENGSDFSEHDEYGEDSEAPPSLPARPDPLRDLSPAPSKEPSAGEWLWNGEVRDYKYESVFRTTATEAWPMRLSNTTGPPPVPAKGKSKPPNRSWRWK